MYAVNINETNFSDEVIRSDRPVLLDLSTHLSGRYKFCSKTYAEKERCLCRNIG